MLQVTMALLCLGHSQKWILIHKNAEFSDKKSKSTWSFGSEFAWSWKKKWKQSL